MVHKRYACETPKDEMRTPDSLFGKLHKRFNFKIDAAATKENRRCVRFFSKEDSALNQPWDEDTFCNPPYSTDLIDLFVAKGQREAVANRVTVAMLLPVDFSTAWWDTCMKASEWIRLKPRVKFNGLDGFPIYGSPFFSSVVVVFQPERQFVLSEMDWRDPKPIKVKE
jgi:phage N-6-adenine-methyltransferase